MQKRKWAIPVAAALLFVSLLVYALNAPREPTYAGHPLSYWVIALAQDTGQIDQQAPAAITGLGTNGLPFFVQWISYEPPQWRYRVAELVEKAPPHWITDRLGYSIQTPRRARLAEGATEAFRILGPTALPALPELASVLNNTSGSRAPAFAAQALSYLGTNALPPLLAVLENPGHPARYWAIQTIGKMPGLHEAAPSVIPALVTCLTDTNSVTVPIEAGCLLLTLGHDPVICTQSLVDSLRTNYARSEVLALRTAHAVCTRALLSEPTPQIRVAITNTLARLDTQLSTNGSSPHL